MRNLDILRQLSDYFRTQNVRNVVILTDENVEGHYSDYFSALSECVSVDKRVLPAGEPSKTIETALSIWNYFVDRQYDRNLFLLNFGGGTVSDLGGFVASAYKRGIRYANVPTTLLAMIDAAIGGKTGVNLNRLKNAVGTFYCPDIELPADISLLKTLPEDELRSGFGELVKYALIGSAELFRELGRSSALPEIREAHVDFCIRFKRAVVRKDPEDRGLRHILNFGHTFGHAIEGYAAETGMPVPHGVAVAQGIFYESLLSTKLGLLPQDEWQQIAAFLTKHFQIPSLNGNILEKMKDYLLNDKKNRHGLVNFTLLDRIGHASPDHQIPVESLSALLNPIS